MAERLAAHLRVLPSALPLIGTLIGNDYMPDTLVALANFHAVAAARHAADDDPPNRRPASAAEARVLSVAAFVRTHGTAAAALRAMEALGRGGGAAGWERLLLERVETSLRRYGAWPLAAEDGPSRAAAAGLGYGPPEQLPAWARPLYADGACVQCACACVCVRA